MKRKIKELERQIAWLGERVKQARIKGDSKAEALMLERRNRCEEALEYIKEQDKNQVGFFFNKEILNKQLGPVVGQFGGWLCVLRPWYVPPVELCDRVAASGYSLEKFRQEARLMFLEDIADRLYAEWRGRALYAPAGEAISPFGSDMKWHELPDSTFWQADGVQPKMDLLEITPEEIEAYMTRNPSQYSRVLPPKPRPPGAGPQGSTAGVPRKPLPSAGGAEVVLPEPEQPESEEDED